MVLINNNSPVVNWYYDKTIFITGGTGFMGKVLIEKLLYACTGIKEIYLLVRPKRGKSPEERIQDMWGLPIFKRLRDCQPDAIKKLIPITGELNENGLGLNEQDLERLNNTVNVVFHLGATLKLEATLKDAIEQNTAGTDRILRVAREMKKLEAFLYFSTAYCSADLEVFEERFYDIPDKPHDVIDVSRWMKEETLNMATASIIAPHPNTYTYSKRLAEKLVAQELENLPVCIIRPSVVCPAMAEPLPGWVDSLNGPMGLLVGAGKGVIRSMYAKGDNRAQFIPVDVAINATIVIAKVIGSATEKPNEIPVYNLTQDDTLPITMGEILEKGRKIVHENPFEMQIWYPDGDIRSNFIIHKIYCIFLHWMPAYFIDFLLFLTRNRRFMIRLQNKIHEGLELLQIFTVREWRFTNKRFIGLRKQLTDDELELFPLDMTVIPTDAYLTTSVLGARQYLMKEDLSSLPRCRTKQKILYVVHKMFVFSVYILLIWMAVSMLPRVKGMFDVVGSYAYNLPVIGTVIAN